ncbi:hypothetical protein LguiA_001122 [Lonicera macranthoides]
MWNFSGVDFVNAEPMWHLGLGTAAESYPERPDEADCIYYLKTGFCGYGVRCRFNHPRDRTSAMGALRAGGGDYPERVGQPVCQYYMRTGMCKFGASCKYHHPRQGGGSTIPVPLNISGYPLRLGEKECSYYLKTGQCKFGVTCKFHHPQPEGIQMAAPAPGPLHAPTIYPAVQSPPVPSSQQYGVVPSNWPVARPTMIPGSYIPGTYSPMLLPPGMLPFPGWSPYQAPLSPVASPNTQPTIGASPIYGITQLSPSAPAYTGPYLSAPSSAGPSGSSQREHAFPERPGQPECHYYMKTGDCKFGSSCRYHHPPEWSAEKTIFVLSPMGLPLRPLVWFDGPFAALPSVGMVSYAVNFLTSAIHVNYLSDLIAGESTELLGSGIPEIHGLARLLSMRVGVACANRLVEGAPLCSHYAQNGVCKFGPSCKFDHPMGTLSYSPSASSLSDMPVAPYPVGSSAGTLAPSSSSSDLRHELTASNKDAFSTRMSSSMSTSSGSIFSRGGPVPHSSMQQPGQSSIPSTGSGSSSGHGGEFPSN